MPDKPTLQDYMLPILEFFADGASHAYADIPRHLQAQFAPIQYDTPGRATFMMNSALGYFKKALVVEEPEKQLYRITERGEQLLGSKPSSLTVKDLRQFPEFDDFIKHRTKPSDVTHAPPPDDDDLPEDAVRRAYALHRENLSEQLLDRIRQSSWRSKVGFREVTEAVLPAPFRLSQPDGWMAQSLVGTQIEPIAGKSYCVEALNRPEYW